MLVQGWIVLGSPNIALGTGEKKWDLGPYRVTCSISYGT